MSTTPAVLFGIPIDNYTMEETIDRLGDFVQLGRLHHRTHQVATVNVDFLVNALTDPQMMALLRQAPLNLPDGMPIVWAARLFGTPVVERVAGADLVPLLADASTRRGWRIHLFGAGPGVADRARSLLLDQYPGSRITSDSGPSIPDPTTIDDTIVESIRAVDPDVLCVALGNPKQEHFIASYRDVLRCPVMIGVGGSLDMLVGDKKRAPEWAQRLGAEWVFRAAQEPGRLGRRYAHDLRVFGPAVFRYRRSVRRYRGLTSIGVEGSGVREILQATTPQVTSAPQALNASTPFRLNLEGIDGLSPQAHALVISALREARLHEIPVDPNGISATLRTCFEDYGTWPLVAQSATGERRYPPPAEDPHDHSRSRQATPSAPRRGGSAGIVS